MSRRSRRKAKQSPIRRNWLTITIVAAIVVVAVVGGYAYETRATATQTTSSSSTSTSSGSGSGNYAVLDTSQGTIVIQLFPQVAPKTVANFESLVNSGFYNDLVWHRIVAGFVIQTGDPNTKGAVNSTRSSWGQGNGPNSVPLETNANYGNNVGYVALAHTSSSTSGSSQFYINLIDNSELNGQYTVFGMVVQGMSVVDAIAALPVYTSSSSPLFDQPINAQSALLISATIQSTP